MPVEEIVKRKKFEAWVSAPPIQRSVRRLSDSRDAWWLGQYLDTHVQFAWEAWCKALEGEEG